MGLSLRNLVYTYNLYRLHIFIKVIEKYTYLNILYTCLKLNNKFDYQKYFDTQQFKIIVNIDRYLLSFFF